MTASIRIYVSDKEKQEWNDFCKREKYGQSQAGYWAIRRFMDDHNPETIRGGFHKALGLMPKYMKQIRKK